MSIIKNIKYVAGQHLETAGEMFQVTTEDNIQNVYEQSFIDSYKEVFDAFHDGKVINEELLNELLVGKELDLEEEKDEKSKLTQLLKQAKEISDRLTGKNIINIDIEDIGQRIESIIDQIEDVEEFIVDEEWDEFIVDEEWE